MEQNQREQFLKEAVEAQLLAPRKVRLFLERREPHVERVQVGIEFDVQASPLRFACGYRCAPGGRELGQCSSRSARAKEDEVASQSVGQLVKVDVLNDLAQ